MSCNNCNCRHCRPRCPAEYLLRMAERLKHPGDLLIVAEGYTRNEDVSILASQVRLAVQFGNLPTGTKLRAIVEQWDQFRIMREIN